MVLPVPVPMALQEQLELEHQAEIDLLRGPMLALIVQAADLGVEIQEVPKLSNRLASLAASV